MSCDFEVTGDVNDNTNGTVRGAVWAKEPDRVGNVMAFATAEVVTAGRFGELECNIGYGTSSARRCNSDGTGGEGTISFGVFTESAGATGAAGSASASATATQGSGSGAAATASSTASATAATGAAGGFGVDAVRLVALVGGAAVAAW